jgi:hypothetical protein
LNPFPTGQVALVEEEKLGISLTFLDNLSLEISINKKGEKNHGLREKFYGDFFILQR